MVPKWVLDVHLDVWMDSIWTTEVVLGPVLKLQNGMERNRIAQVREFVGKHYELNLYLNLQQMHVLQLDYKNFIVKW